MEPTQTLAALVPERLKPLQPMEEKLLAAALLGEPASDDADEAVVDLEALGEAQVVRGELLAWLLTDPGCQPLIHYRGVHLRGAKITGGLDLQDARVGYPLRLVKCIIDAQVVLERGEFHYLQLSGSYTGAIRADEVKVKHDLEMNQGFKAQGEVRLLGAEIGGQLVCSGGAFENAGGVALMCDRMHVKRSVFLRNGFQAKGEVRLLGAEIGGALVCSGGAFENPGGNALCCDGMSVKGDIFLLNSFKAQGAVRLLGAQIGGQLACHGGVFENPNGDALACDRMHVQGSIFLGYDDEAKTGFKAQGEVRLLGAEIGSNLECGGGVFENAEGYALTCDRMHVQGSTFLDYDDEAKTGFKAQGQVRLIGAEIGGQFSCRGGAFENAGGIALACDGMLVKGDVFLQDSFQAKGEVRLPGAEIGGDLDCSGGDFENHGREALNCVLMRVKGVVSLGSGFTAQGAVDLTGAEISGHLLCNGGKFGGDFNGVNLKVDGIWGWTKQEEKINGTLMLANARLANLMDDEASWPATGKLDVDGLVYGPFTSVVPADAESRLRWLGLQDPGRLTVQPYEQLAAVFRQMGLRDDARAVAVAKQRHIRAHLRGWSKVGSWIQDATIGYGYYPWKVLFFILPLLVLGTLVFGWGFAHGLMAPTIDHPQFALFTAQAQAPSARLAWDAFAYSLDVFLPIVDLHQESAWAPDAVLPGGTAVLYYLVFHILMGWVLTTLGVAGFTGLVRSD
jgi:sRNA-binding regulator protein Hfq